MAATVESAFILIDRASPAIRSIRRELAETEVQAKRTGRALDDTSGPRAAKQLEMTARETKTVGREMHTTAGEMDRAEQSMGRFQNQTQRTHKDLVRLGAEIRSVGTLLRLLRWPALIAGAGAAAQALGGLAGGATALVPKLLQAGGAAASVGVLYAGLGAAVVTTRLATKDLSQALGGNQQALNRLTPEARGFLQVLRQMNPEMERMRRVAQRGLFPGLTDALGSVRSQAPGLRRIVGQTAGDVGNLARFGGRQLAQPGAVRDLATLSNEGGRALGTAARSGFYFAQALEQVLIAAGPFTDWLDQGIERFAKWADHEATVARQTGELDGYFVKVREDIKLLLDVGEHTFGGLQGLLRAATGQGNDLWGSIDKAARRWDRWSNSFQGQMAMRRWFDDVRPALHETVGLVGDLGQALGHLSAGPEAATMLHSLREALPSIEKGVSALTSSLGPAAADALASGLSLLGDLSQEAGPLSLLAHSLAALARSLDFVVRSLGPAGPALASFAGTALLLRRAGLVGGGGGGLGFLPFGGGGGGGAAGGMSAAEAAVIGGGAAAVGGRLFAGGAGALGGGLSRTAGGVILPAGVRSVEAAAMATGSTGMLAGLRGAAGAGFGALRAPGGAARALGAGGRFFWPVALASGLLGALGTQGGAGARLQGGASALTFGVVPRPISEQERQTAGGQYAANVIDELSRQDALGGHGLRGQRAAISGLRQRIAMLPGNDAFDQNKGDLRQATDLLRVELKRREGMLRESERATRQDMRAKSVEHAQALFRDFTSAFDVRSRHDGPEAAMDRMTKGMLDKLSTLKPAGRKVLAESALAWAREQERHNPKLRDEYQQLVRGIERDFFGMGRTVQVVNGQVLTGSTREWQNIRLALTSQTEKAREEVAHDFTAIQEQAVGSLRAMGFSSREARQMVGAMDAGRKGARAQASRANTRRAVSVGPGYSPYGPIPQSSYDNATGDGPGLDRPSAGRVATASRTASAGLMGASPDLAPYDAIAHRYDLRVSSGLRPGAITASGNSSLHATGHAIDEAGPAAGMLGYARFMASHYGSQLEELIHTPLGYGIKNGRRVPLSYWGPEINAEHYSHVHVGDVNPGAVGVGAAGGPMGALGALMGVDLRAPGSRLGGAPGAMSSAAGAMFAAGLSARLNQQLGAAGGGGGGLTSAGGQYGKGRLASLWVRAGGDPAVANLMASIALAESGGSPRAHNPSGASGLWQILGQPFPGNVYNPLTNARMAVAKYRTQGLGAWEAYTNGAYRRFGDGLGWSRPSMGRAGMGPSFMSAGGSGGDRSIHVHPGAVVIRGGGSDSARVRRIVDRRLAQFAAAVHAEVLGGREISEAGAM